MLCIRNQSLNYQSGRGSGEEEISQNFLTIRLSALGCDISVIYYGVTNHPGTCGLKQQTFILALECVFSWARLA